MTLPPVTAHRLIGSPSRTIWTPSGHRHSRRAAPGVQQQSSPRAPESVSSHAGRPHKALLDPIATSHAEEGSGEPMATPDNSGPDEGVRPTSVRTARARLRLDPSCSASHSTHRNRYSSTSRSHHRYQGPTRATVGREQQFRGTRAAPAPRTSSAFTTYATSMDVGGSSEGGTSGRD